MTTAHYGTPSEFFAVAESFKGMNKHVLNPNGGYTALSFLPAAIRANEARSNQPLPRLLGWQLAEMTMMHIHRWASEYVCAYPCMALQSQKVHSECHSVLMLWLMPPSFTHVAKLVKRLIWQ